MKKLLSVLLCAVIALFMTSCGAKISDSTDDTAQRANASSDITDEEVSGDEKSDSGYDLSFTDRDCDPSYDESAACKINFNNNSASVSYGSGATVNNCEVTVNSRGTYVFSGQCSNGQILVKAGENDKVQLVLDGIELASSSSPLVIESADKVFLTIAASSENSLADSDDYELLADGSTVDGAIFSKADLTINGSGTLDVNGNYKHAIVSKDDLVITGGKLNITSKTAAVDGKDCVKIKSADISVSSGGDGIRSTNTEETDIRGFVYIESGTVKIDCTNDALQACSLLRVDSGDFDITSGGGFQNGETHIDNFGGMGMFSDSSDSDDSESAKGVKSADAITFNGGTFSINSSDDAVHSDNSITIEGGVLNIKSGDDGLHADSTLTINGGTVSVLQSYEGIEAEKISVNDGTVSIVSGDDGFNASSGDGDSSEGFTSDSNSSLAINGGYVVVDASGDGLDSNGSLTISGGTTLVSGPESDGNGSLDYDSEATITGGVLIALGSSGMAQSVTGSGQCTIMTDVTYQSSGTSFALCNDSGVVASFTPTKSYNSVVISTPDIKTGETYTVICGGAAENADSNGFCTDGSLSGGSQIASIEMTDENYVSSGSMNGSMGGGMNGGRGGGRQQPFM